MENSITATGKGRSVYMWCMCIQGYMRIVSEMEIKSQLGNCRALWAKSTAAVKQLQLLMNPMQPAYTRGEFAVFGLQTSPLIFKYSHQQSPDVAARFLACI